MQIDIDSVYMGRIMAVSTEDKGVRVEDGEEKKSTGWVDRLVWGGIIVQLNGDKRPALFNKMTKIICVGACDGMFSRRLNIRHKKPLR